jgi:hypothetical protein
MDMLSLQDENDCKYGLRVELAEEESETVMLKPLIGNEMSTGDRKGINYLSNRLNRIYGVMELQLKKVCIPV